MKTIIYVGREAGFRGDFVEAFARKGYRLQHDGTHDDPGMFLVSLGHEYIVDVGSIKREYPDSRIVVLYPDKSMLELGSGITKEYMDENGIVYLEKPPVLETLVRAFGID